MTIQSHDGQDGRSTPEDGASAGVEATSYTLVQARTRGHVMPMAPDDDAKVKAMNQTAHRAQAQAHPPAAGGQPLPLFEQHQDFFATLHPCIQLAKPASQSYGSDDVTHPPPWFGQPLP